MEATNTATRQMPPKDPMVGPGHNITTITEKLSDIVLEKPVPKGWYYGATICFMLLMLLLASVTYLFVKGVGIWGVTVPAAWGFAIINFVWWIGIGHAGTLISAILCLLRQEWRTSINRFAEAMTLFAVACAGVFPLIHVGRPWLAYWLLPYPNTMGMWPQFRSPLLWDVFAVSTYATVSLLFWYVGLIPDLATMRDRARTMLGKRIYGIFALGWRNACMHWERYEIAYLILAGISTPLVVSVHSVVSFDFAVSVIPGWHTTIFPPYFVAGAVYSGFAMVLTLAIPVRKFYGLEDFITMRHMHNMAKVMLATGLIVAYGYAMEAFFAWYSASAYEGGMMQNRYHGWYAWSYWCLIACNIVIPQLLWLRKVRDSIAALFVISIVINIGMWLERFVIVVTSLAQDFLPSSWGWYVPTFWDYATYIGTFGLFGTLFFLFIRFVPMINIFEMRTLVKHSKPLPDGKLAYEPVRKEASSER